MATQPKITATMMSRMVYWLRGFLVLLMSIVRMRVGFNGCFVVAKLHVLRLLPKFLRKGMSKTKESSPQTKEKCKRNA